MSRDTESPEEDSTPRELFNLEEFQLFTEEAEKTLSSDTELTRELEELDISEQELHTSEPSERDIEESKFPLLLEELSEDTDSAESE